MGLGFRGLGFRGRVASDVGIWDSRIVYGPC